MVLSWKSVLWLLSILSNLLSVHLGSLLLVPMFCKPVCTSAFRCTLKDRRHNVALLLLKVVCWPPIICNNYQIWETELLTEWIQKQKLSICINNISDYITERIINSLFFSQQYVKMLVKSLFGAWVISWDFLNYPCHHVYWLVCWKLIKF